MDFSFTGVIRHVSDAQSVTTASGLFNKREILVETEEQYPESMAIELTGEDAINFTGFAGQRATFHLHFRCNRSASGNLFCRIRAWRYTIHQ